MNTTVVYPFEFEKYRTKANRGTCHSCGRAHSLVPYVFTATGERLPEQFGRCNRVDSCGYHLKPTMKDLNIDDQQWEKYMQELAARPEQPNIVVDMPSDLLIDSLDWNEENTLYKYLIKLLPADVVKWLFKEYLVGNHPVWPGAVVFWFVTILGQIRAGQIKQFENGHTVKMPDKTGRIKPRTIWIHSLIIEPLEWLQAYLDQKTRCDCLFGEHLLAKYLDKWVAIFESPKTAILAAAHFPDAVCLAVGALDYLTYDRVKVLKGRKVILYPDLSKDGKTFASWSEKADRFKGIADFKVSRILEDNATDEQRALGLDMADFMESWEYVNDNQSIKEEEGICNPKVKNSLPDYELTRAAQNETNRWENGATDFIDSLEKSEECRPLKKEVLTPQSGKPTSELFDGAEYLRWMKQLAPLKPCEIIRIASCQHPIYNIQFFVQGRLKAIESWKNSTRSQGDGPLFKTQLTELRTILNNRQTS